MYNYIYNLFRCPICGLALHTFTKYSSLGYPIIVSKCDVCGYDSSKIKTKSSDRTVYNEHSSYSSNTSIKY